MAESITLDDIISEYGNFYEKGSQSVADLKKLVLPRTETDTLFQKKDVESEKYKTALVDVSQVWQPYQHGFTPKGGIEFSPREAILDPIKMDLKLLPAAVQSSWLQFLKDNNIVDPAQAPITKYFLETVLENAPLEWELNVAFKAEKVAPTPGVPGPSAQSINGIRKKIRMDYNAGDSMLIPVPVALLNTNDDKDVCTFMEEFVRLILLARPEMGAFGGTLAVAPEIFVRFQSGKRLKYNMNYAQDTNLETVIGYQQFKVKGLLSQQGSKMVWFSPLFNNFSLAVTPNRAQIFDSQKEDRYVKFLTNLWRGYHFSDPRYLFHNDQDLV